MSGLLPPAEVSSYGPGKVLANMNALMARAEASRGTKPVPLQTYADDNVAAGPAAPIEGLLPLRSLLDLNSSMNQRAKGKFLQGKIKVPAFHMVATYLVVETDEGLCVPVVVYHYLPFATWATSEQCAAAFPVGSTLIVREPYAKLYPERNVLIRVDNPSDIEVVRPLPEGTDAAALRESGNEKLRQKQYQDALMYYTQSVNLSPSKSADKVLALSNRAEVYLKVPLGFFRQLCTLNVYLVY